MKYILLSISIIFLFSCSFNDRYLPNKYNYVNQKEFDKDYKTVWRALSDLIATWGLAPDNIDKESGLIVITGSLDQNYNIYCDCGTEGKGFGWFHKITNPSWRATISVTEMENKKTKVKINTFYGTNLNLYNFNYNTNQYYLARVYNIDCNSKGKLEKQILNYIEMFN